METLEVLSNAKINLFFAINALRPDQFCDLTSIMVPISLCDTLTFFFEKNDALTLPQVEVIFSHIRGNTHATISPNLILPDQVSLNTTQKINTATQKTDTDNNTVPMDANTINMIDNTNIENNTIHRAVQLFSDYTKWRSFSLRVEVQKKIPIGGGFGGGSSNGTFTLRALNYFFSNILTREELLFLSRKLGTDCAFFVDNCPQLALQRGDELQPLALRSPEFYQKLKSYRCLIFCPSFSVSTADAYRQFKRHPIFAKNSDGHVHRILSSDRPLLFNSFEPQLLRQYPLLNHVFSELSFRGYFPHVTGSGSGCFVLYRDIRVLEQAQKIVQNILGNDILCEIVSFL